MREGVCGVVDVDAIVLGSRWVTCGPFWWYYNGFCRAVSEAAFGLGGPGASAAAEPEEGGFRGLGAAMEATEGLYGPLGRTAGTIGPGA